MYKKEDMLDICSKWIQNREASYISKDDKVVWFASWTGREEDKSWRFMSLQETIRAIKYAWMDADANLTSSILMQAFQELGEVYEVAIESDYEVIEGVFNFSSHTPTTVHEKVAKELTLLVKAKGWGGLLIKDVISIFSKVQNKIGTKVSPQTRNKYLRKHFKANGFQYREGRDRVFYKGAKVTAMLHTKRTVSSIVELSEVERKDLASIIYTKVK